MGNKKDKGKMLGDGKMLTPRFRIDWPHVCERRPKDAKVNAGKFDITAIFDKDKTDFTLLNKIIEDAGKGLGKRFKKPLKSGEEERDGEDGYENSRFCTLSAKKFKPTVMDATKAIIEDDDEIVPGSFGRAIISAWSYNNENQGVAFNLYALQCLGGGKRLAKGGDGNNSALANESFEELDEMEDTEEPDDIDDDDNDLD